MDRKTRIKALGLTQRQLAARVGIKDDVVSRYVRGVSGAGGGYLPAILDALELMTSEQREAWLAAPACVRP